MEVHEMMRRIFRGCLYHWKLSITAIGTVILSGLGIMVFLTISPKIEEWELFFLAAATGQMVFAPFTFIFLLYLKYIVEGKVFD